MANGKITLGKQSGGTLGLVFHDGVSNTEVVLPESGELATKGYVDGLNSTNVKTTGDQTIAGAKLFSSRIILDNGTIDTPEFMVSDPINNSSAYLDMAAENFRIVTSYRGGNPNVPFSLSLYNNVVSFSNSPIVPTPTMGTQAVTKAYADLKVALADFTGGNQSLISNGYQKLPGGLILQWATVVESASETDYNTFPIAFPTTCLMVNIQLNSATPNGLGVNVGTVIHLIDRTKFIWTAGGNFGGGGVAYMFAIGY